MKLPNIFNLDKLICLICDKKCGKIYTTLKYRYEDEQVGEVFLCESCSREYDLDEDITNNE